MSNMFGPSYRNGRLKDMEAGWTGVLGCFCHLAARKKVIKTCATGREHLVNTFHMRQHGSVVALSERTVNGARRFKAWSASSANIPQAPTPNI